MLKFLNSSALSIFVSETADFLSSMGGMELDLPCLSKGQVSFALSSKSVVLQL